MKHRFLAILAAASVGFASVGLVTAARADDAKGVTGTWKWEFKRQNGDPITVTLKLKQDGEKVTGEISGRDGNFTDIKDGKYKDGDLTFTVVREFNGNTITQKYKGKLDGEKTIKGKVEGERNGEAYSRDWEAKRE